MNSEGEGYPSVPATTPGRLPGLLPTQQVWSSTAPTAHPAGLCERRPLSRGRALEKQSQDLIPRCGEHRIYTWNYQHGFGLGSRSRLGELDGKSKMALNR